MDRIDGDQPLAIWRRIVKGVVKREAIDLSSVCYDGTNFYTFIDTFNMRCETAKRGKNKQGRDNLRQVSYALFCSADGQFPLFYDVYEGNRNDAKQFPLMLRKFHRFFQELVEGGCTVPDTTLIFDKGNNSADNFELLDALEFSFVGSVKLDEHKELAGRSNDDPAFVPCGDPTLEGTKAFRVEKSVYGRERTLVVTYNQNLFNAQWLTVQNDIGRAMEKLASLKQKLEDRADGILTQGRAPTKEGVEKQCHRILRRQHMKRVIRFEVTQGPDAIVRLEYGVDSQALQELSDTYLGKNILITDRAEWDNEKIIEAYRSQFLIEDVFKEMKDRTTGNWWPLLHWTESKIQVHGLYCTIAVLLRALLLRRVRKAGLRVSMKRVLSELDAIREVVNIYPRKRGQKTASTQTVLTKTSELQQNLMSILKLEKEENSLLG
jgi:transposase